MLRAFFALVVVLMVGAALGVALASPRTQAGVEENIGAQLPIDLPLRDEADQPITLRQCIAGKPTILVPMYYRCPMNCNLVLANLVKALRAMDDEHGFRVGRQFNIVCVSFDPKEHGPDAAAKKQVTLGEYGRPGVENGWRFLTGSKESVAATMQTIGYHFEFDKAYKEYNHPNAIVILSPEGKATRYLYGFNYGGEIEVQGESVKQEDGTMKKPTTTLRLSLIEAADGKGGSVLDKLVLLCYRFDHLNKGYSVNVLRVVQLGGILTLLVVGTGVGLTLWRERRAARAALPRGDAANSANGPRAGGSTATQPHDGPPSGGTT
jgi:protein SCO1/2